VVVGFVLWMLIDISNYHLSSGEDSSAGASGAFPFVVVVLVGALLGYAPDRSNR